MARPAQRADLLSSLGEVFRNYGFEGASLARITEGTGLGKGSLYHVFPGGKEEMAEAVLAQIDAWFHQAVYAPLRASPAGGDGIAPMFAEVARYFLSGRKVCLVGVFALGGERDRFGAAVKAYFAEWIAALAQALQGVGHPADAARALAEEVVGGIQGALVLARALDQPDAFLRLLKRLEQRCQPPP